MLLKIELNELFQMQKMIKLNVKFIMMYIYNVELINSNVSQIIKL